MRISNRITATLVSAALAWPVVVSTGEPAATSSHAEAQATYGALLADYVRDGWVDYGSLREDPRLPQYIEHLSRFDYGALDSRDDVLAHLINAYNAYTLQVICENYPVDSINDLHFGGLYVGTVLNKTVWDKEFVVLGGEEMSLNHLEHEIIRKDFGDARIHFALVCAAVSCPVLRAEAYTGDRLSDQLDEQGRRFFSNAAKNRFDADSRRAYLSKILDWYADDFGGSDPDVLTYVARFLEEPLARSIRENAAEWRVSYTEYDWALNDTARRSDHTSE